jgi:hypothetical protein
MAVYREGFYAVNELQQNQIQIFTDAADYGAPVRKDDKLWNLAKQLIQWYGVENSRIEYSTGVTANVKLVDEWAVSDERKTMAQATEIYIVSFTKCTTGACKGYDGFINVERKK